jgi:MbtH protein
VTDPFENECGTYHVIRNSEGQHSLWPSFIDVPQGWIIVHPSKTRAECVEFVNQNWIDMRPKSLVEVIRKEASVAQEHTVENGVGPEPGNLIATTETQVRGLSIRD